MKKPGSTRNRVYMVRTTLALVLVALFFAVGGGILYVRNQPATKTFTSDNMKVTLTFPIGYTLREGLTSIVLEKTDLNDRKIIFRKYGSMFLDTKTHVDASLVRQKETPLMRNVATSVNVSILGEMVEYKHDSVPYRVYYFVKDYVVYQFETDDPALFSDLDSIAKSFRILE